MWVLKKGFIFPYLFVCIKRSMGSKTLLLIERVTIELGSTGSTERNECVRNVTIGE
jgi:hypothetical protein